MLLCGQGAASVKHVARYNNSTTSAVAFPAYRNEANLAPGSGCCHSCTLDIKRAPSARCKKRQGMRVLRAMGCGGGADAAAVGWRWRQGVECVWRWWCAEETGNRFLFGLCALHLNLQVCLSVVDGQQTLGLWTRRGETETTVKSARCTRSNTPNKIANSQKRLISIPVYNQKIECSFCNRALKKLIFLFILRQFPKMYRLQYGLSLSFCTLNPPSFHKWI
jgi:hypothetical protein